MILQTPAVISKITTMANRSLRFQVDSQEGLTDEQMGKFTALHEKFGHFVFSPDTQVKEEDLLELPPLPKDDSDTKSPSQRLRARMFVYYKETHTEDKFNEWYSDTLNRLGQQYLDKLE